MATYLTPGVYAEEIPSGNRTITGVSTSLCAFVGRTRRGPVNTPTRISSFSEFERRFGGLWVGSTLSQCVRHFFLNQGGEALIVRVVNESDDDQDRAEPSRVSVPYGLRLRATAEALAIEGFHHFLVTVDGTTLTVSAADEDDALLNDGTDNYTITADLAGIAGPEPINAALTSTATPIPLVEVVGALPVGAPVANETTTLPGSSHEITLAVSMVQLAAADPGSWGDRLRVHIDSTDAAPGSFHLTLTELSADLKRTVSEEVHYGVSLDPAHPRYLGRLLELKSNLARLEGVDSALGPVAEPEAWPMEDGRDGAPPRVNGDLHGTPDQGIHTLERVDLFNLLCIPLESWSVGDGSMISLWSAALKLCEQERAFLLMDPPEEWASADDAISGAETFSLRSENAGIFYPRVLSPDPLRESRLSEFPPCGVVAGIIARTDSSRGLWKAPAGTDASTRGVSDLTVKLTDAQQGQLNPLGINCLRSFPIYGTVVWGARTGMGADALASEWKYIPVRRLALFLEESLVRGVRWAVFEGNDEPLWGQLRKSISGFLHQLYLKGAFAGRSPREAYFVKCDRETTIPSDVARGIVNVVVGYAPLKPAEFVILQLQQLTDQGG